MKLRQDYFARFNRWEHIHRERLSPQEAIRRISEIYEMFPEKAKKKDLNKKIEGIRKMHEALSVLERKDS